MTDDHIDEVLELYSNRETVEKEAFLASFEDIEKNDFNLNIPRYVDTFEKEEDSVVIGRGGSRLQPESFLHRVLAGDRTDLCRVFDRCPHRGGKASADLRQQPHERYCV